MIAIDLSSGYDLCMSASKLRLYHRLQTAARVLQKSADRRVAEGAGLSTSQAAVLAIIDAGGVVTQRDVARTLKLNESAVTAMISRLINLELVVRTRSPDDKRVWVLRLGRNGKKAVTLASRSFAGINARMESCLSSRDLENLVAWLDRLTAEFDD